MKKKFFSGLLALLFTFTLLISGCGKDESLSKSLQNAYEKSSKLESYTFKSSIKFDDMQMSGTQFQDEASLMILNLFKNAELSINGVMQQKPLQMEATVDVTIKGDMSLTFSLPMVITETKMYMKIPNVPMLAGIVPPQLVDKFIEFDINELAKEQGGSTGLSPAELDASQKLVNEIYKELIPAFDEKTFFKEVAVKDAKLPKDISAEQVIKFTVDQKNFDKAVTAFVKDALPKILDVLSKEEYLKVTQMKASDIEQAKKDLKANDSEINKNLEEMKKSLQINEFSITSAINKEGYPTYQTFVVNADLKEKDESMKLAFKVTSETNNINKKQTFKVGIPKDAIKSDELETMMGTGL